jgi:colicin import membrane protein
MVREHENSQAVKAAFLALTVHVVFFLVLVLSFNWKSEMPLQVSDVQLWDSLPPPKAQAVPPPEPEPPKPEPKPEIKPEPKPEPPPEPEPKADIAVKKPEPKPEPKPKPEKKESPKPDPAELKKKEEALKKKEELLKKKAEEKRQQEILRKLQQMDDPLAEKALNDELKHLDAARNAAQAQQAATASAGEVDEYKARIRNKIYSWMNRQSCGNAVPEYSISVMPTGQVAGTPKLLKSSGIPACDDAAMRAIMQAQPLPLPSEPELFASFRDLRIPFKPEQ